MNRGSSSSSGKTDCDLKEHESGYYNDTTGSDGMTASKGRPNGSEQRGSYFGGSRAEQGNIAELSDTGLSEIDGTQRSSELYEGLPGEFSARG